jgi:ethanolaminephosphotransferase
MIFPLTALTILRLTRSWNQTGQKFAGEPDIVKLFLLPNPKLLWLVVISMYMLLSFRILPGLLDGLPYTAATSLTALLVSSAFAFKLAFTAEDAPELVSGFAEELLRIFGGQSLLFRARLVFALLGVCAAFGVYRSLTGSPRAVRASGKSPSPLLSSSGVKANIVAMKAQLLHHLYTLLAMTQSRATNIPILLLSTFMLNRLQSITLSVPEITVTSILLQFATFFAYGGSNAISSVDLSSAYNGISGFNVLAVGLLTLIGNWAGPIFWTSATNLLLLERYHGKQGEERVFLRHAALLTVFTAASMACVMAACTALRTHLFIWTVFSPKYLYCMAWSLGQHLLINIGFGGFLFWLGAR